ncbi:984_t:CDS:2, partial [Paraglomus occultum]
SESAKTTLNDEQRAAVITHKYQNPHARNIDLVNWIRATYQLDVHPSTVSRLLKRKESIISNPSAKRHRTVQHPNLENALYEWVIQMQTKVILTDAILVQKAKDFSQLLNIPDDDFKFSCGWLSRFKKRHGLKQIKKHGEAASADTVAILKTIPELKEILKSYDLKDIFNMDETGLFYRYYIDNYLDYPEETITEVELTDQEIIDLVTHEVKGVENVVEDIYLENAEDDSVERRRITHKEALNCLETLALYLVQQDIDDVVRLEHDRELVRLSVKRLEDASRKQTNITSFLQ